MKTRPAIILSIIALAGVTALLANTGSQTPQFDLGGNPVADLERRLGELELKVAALESENRSLKASIGRLGSVSITPQPDWKTKEFNGDTYYIIPIKSESE